MDTGNSFEFPKGEDKWNKYVVNFLAVKFVKYLILHRYHHIHFWLQFLIYDILLSLLFSHLVCNLLYGFKWYQLFSLGRISILYQTRLIFDSNRVPLNQLLSLFLWLVLSTQLQGFYFLNRNPIFVQFFVIQFTFDLSWLFHA